MFRTTARIAPRLAPVVSVVVLGATLVCAGPGLSGQSGPGGTSNPVSAGTRNGEWPTYGGDLAQHEVLAARSDQRDELQQARSRRGASRPTASARGRKYKLEGTPLMVNGVLYATAGTRRAVVALDAATGELLWVHGEHEGARAAAAPRQLSGRGLAYWTDGKEERILYTTPGYRLIALDAKTGTPIPTFGKNGAVDLKLDDDQQIMPDLTTGEIGIHSAPVVAKDVVIVGAAFREGMTPKSYKNNKGYVRGFDVRTGKRLWIFHTIPMKGEFGYDTWENGFGRIHGQHRRVDADLGRRGARAGRICRWNRRPATTTAAIVPATISTARASCASISRPASASGTTSSCTIRCGTRTFRRRRFSPTSR